MENKLKELRVAHHLTQETLGEKVGLSRQTISSIERNQTIPSLLIACKIAAYFHVSVDAIFKI